MKDIRTITLPTVIKTLGDEVFKGCSKLRILMIRENCGITSIGKDVFSETDNLQIYLKNTNDKIIFNRKDNHNIC